MMLYFFPVHPPSTVELSMTKFYACSGMVVNADKTKAFLSPHTHRRHKEELSRRFHMSFTADMA